MRKQLYAGIDLHSNNLVIAIVDAEGKRIGHRKLNCELCEVTEYLEPWREQLAQIAVESTYNWYWLVDGLQDAGYSVVLANPAGMSQYNGLKHSDDKSDAFWIAELLRLNILPQGYIYERKIRGVRDLLRRRGLMVHKRTALMLSLKNQHARTHGKTLAVSRLKAACPREMGELFSDPNDQLSAQITKAQIESFDAAIARIERACWSQAGKIGGHRNINTLPGIGPVLSGTIVLEVGDITRFKTPEAFASYCRTVPAPRKSNGKTKGFNNAKCGNKYLAWALIEAANFCRRHDGHARRWFDRKRARSNRIIATKALAAKLAKAIWHLMTHGGSYDPARLFGKA